jgi:hypothetical protein
VAGYAANARLQGAAPQFALTGEHAPGAATLTGTSSPARQENGIVVDQLDLVGRPVDEMIGDWFASLGESWSQLTFFLFDPESWR